MAARSLAVVRSNQDTIGLPVTVQDVDILGSGNHDPTMSIEA